MNGACSSTYLAPPPGAQGKESKLRKTTRIKNRYNQIPGQISLHFNFKVNFRYFYAKLCVFSQMKYKADLLVFQFCHLGYAVGCDLGVLGDKH